MYLVEILIPLTDNDGNDFPRTLFDRTRQELIDQFGGLTAFLRAPASGIWTTPDGTVQRDSIAVLEVMTEIIDRQWWRRYCEKLEERFAQESMVIRSSVIEIL